MEKTEVLDPDPAFLVNADRGSESRDVISKNCIKKITIKKLIFDQKWSCPRFRRSLQYSIENIQNFKTKHFFTVFFFCGSFFTPGSVIPNADPDPHWFWSAGSGSTTPVSRIARPSPWRQTRTWSRQRDQLREVIPTSWYWNNWSPRKNRNSTPAHPTHRLSQAFSTVGDET